MSSGAWQLNQRDRCPDHTAENVRQPRRVGPETAVGCRPQTDWRLERVLRAGISCYFCRNGCILHLVAPQPTMVTVPFGPTASTAVLRRCWRLVPWTETV